MKNSCLWILSLPFLALAVHAGDFDPSEVEPQAVPSGLFVTAGDNLEVTLWARSPLLFNPTNIDVDREGRIWVAEGIRYRRHHDRQPGGDRIMVVEDTDGDGQADESHCFVQEPALVAPLGIAVIGNRVVVSQPPDLIVYTDVDGDLVFDPEVDEREVLLTGFQGKNHDHSLHSVTVGPDSKWYFNSGNTGAKFTDADGNTWRIGGAYRPKPIGPFPNPHDYESFAGKPSDDGHVYVGGFTVRMDPDATDVEIIGHNYRNSYEQSITSFGDVFQNDNDDPPACRVSYVMEYANFGFCSNDGQRSWRSDQRPGQDIATAEWRQDDPGIYPAGDVYGGGSPTGNCFYENGALGENFRGLFLACEAGRNVVFGYQPEPDGASFTLDRFDFVTSNPASEHDKGRDAAERFAGSDFLGGGDSVTGEVETLFRPSDVVVGPDGALYISDWYDPRVGGHQDLDETCSGAIYRVAPKGFQPQVPQFDLSTIEGAITALRSPAVNVRELGREALRGLGTAGIPALRNLLEDPNPYLAVRAVWVLGQLGAEGIAEVVPLLERDDPQLQIAAFRTLRRTGHDVLAHADFLARQENPALRREAALALRDRSFAESRDLLLEIARGYDGQDRSYLEALGTGSTGKQAQCFALFRQHLGSPEPTQWSDAFADLAWRLRNPLAVPALQKRALASDLPYAQRKQATDALAFTQDRSAAKAMIHLASHAAPEIQGDAKWWLLHRANNDWKDYGILPRLKQMGIYDPDNIEVIPAELPEPTPEQKKALPPIAELMRLQGDPERGKAVAMRCVMCHQVEGQGVSYAPALEDWGRTQTREVIFRSIVDPSADIAHGFHGTEIRTKDGKIIHGLLLSKGNPKIIRSMGGITQTIPNKLIKSRKKMERSLMLSAAQLGLTAQDVADVVAYLKQNR